MSGDRFLAGLNKFSPLHSLWTGSGAHTTSFSVGTGGSYPGVKRLGLGSDHSPPSGVEVKNGEAVPPLTHVSSRYFSFYLDYTRVTP
jgi:hypothetical protein